MKKKNNYKNILPLKVKNRKLNIKTKYNLKKNNYILGVLYNKKFKINKYFYYKDNIKYYYYNKYKFFNIIYKNKKYLSIIKEIQYHPISDKIIHIDFLYIKNKDIITTYINIKFIGKPIGVIKGGVLEIIKKRIKIKSKYKNLPIYFKINISKLEINDKIFIKNLLNNKFIILENINNIICFIRKIKTLKKKKK
ncbi:MAG: 50S ribosomal protein L25 [Candidatus Shikimatogenerans sp. Tser]|uniref:50S ribosomal protein L25 n=1 Tax=Candidatus Shikimatogenerans sp. Tser TaxID=3158568 RepID=A0AAU7QT68_9FLAO